MLSRLDTNGNGILDPEEQQGPAQFMISRMSQADPSIQAGKPISLKKISESFAKMREQASASRGGPQRGDSSAADEALVPELLVPGFGLEEEPTPLMGFGATAEMLSVVVTEEDKREAAERMRRYDRNKDGYLTKDELSSRFAGNPMDFDRNRDGKLSASELAVRYARRREGEEEARSARNDRREREPERRGGEPEDLFNGRKSYRIELTRKLPEGLPGFFQDKDANGDGQVAMAEFATDWTDDVVAEYFRSDLNRDGVITADEAIRALEQGDTSSGGSTVAMTSSSTASSGSSGATSSSSSSSSPAPAVTGKLDPKLVSYAEKIVTRNDKNGDKVLTVSEWKEMLLSPAAADADRDGKITIEEYARWMASRSKRR